MLPAELHVHRGSGGGLRDLRAICRPGHERQVTRAGALHAAYAGDAQQYLELAKSVAEGRGYELQGRPTAWRPPMYPFILAGEIVRITEQVPPGMVIHIDRERTPSEALQLAHRRASDERGSERQLARVG